jgi:hypothetical protein
MVQALKKPGRNWYGGTTSPPGYFDADANPAAYFGHRILPGYPGRFSEGQPLSIIDRPKDTNIIGATTWQITISAVERYVCRETEPAKYHNKVLGSISFTFYDEIGGAVITFGTETRREDRRDLAPIRAGAASPDDVWNEAVRDW